MVFGQLLPKSDRLFRVLVLLNVGHHDPVAERSLLVGSRAESPVQLGHQDFRS